MGFHTGFATPANRTASGSTRKVSGFGEDPSSRKSRGDIIPEWGLRFALCCCRVDGASGKNPHSELLLSQYAGPCLWQRVCGPDGHHSSGRRDDDLASSLLRARVEILGNRSEQKTVAARTSSSH